MLFSIKTCPVLGEKSNTESRREMITKSFNADPYPGIDEKLRLAKLLNTSQRSIEKAFERMRSKKAEEGMFKKSE